MNAASITKESIRELLRTNDKAVDRAVMALFKRQTPTEREHGVTQVNNGVGVGYAHARPLTYYAKWIEKGNRLSGMHLERARKMVMRYAGQLARYALELKGQSVVTNDPHPDDVAMNAMVREGERREHAMAYANKGVGAW